METSASFEARSAPSSYPTTDDDPTAQAAPLAGIGGLPASAPIKYGWLSIR
jgi:hypothetical protein